MITTFLNILHANTSKLNPANRAESKSRTASCTIISRRILQKWPISPARIVFQLWLLLATPSHPSAPPETLRSHTSKVSGARSVSWDKEYIYILIPLTDWFDRIYDSHQDPNNHNNHLHNPHNSSLQTNAALLDFITQDHHYDSSTTTPPNPTSNRKTRTCYRQHDRHSTPRQ